MSWYPAYIGIGSNLQQPIKQVWRALSGLAGLTQVRLELTSPFYRSESLKAGQPQYINAVAGLLTQLAVRPLFDAVRELELKLGRQPRERWGPRPIDLDLLLYGQMRLEEPDLVLPHPGIVQRNFVLYPLRDVAPELNVPGLGRVATLADGVGAAGIWRLNNDEISGHGA
jgi:2-amino-4-hydroxy-6-hydroxymethyldihydropteridine diphosphokinase